LDLQAVMFFLVFFIVYGGLQAYVMAKVVAAFGWTGRKRLYAWFWALLMTLAPLFLWWLEHCDCRILGATVAALTYGWMGLAFLFFWLALGLDAWRFLGRRLGLPVLDARRSFYLAGVLVLALSGYGLHAALHPVVERLETVTDKLPAGVGRLRIVLVSDVHLGVMMGPRRLPHVLDRVAALKPDILISTGDLVDGGSHHLDGLAPLFAAIQPRFGKYAVSGNHEYIKGIENAVKFHQQAGFRMLRAEAVEPVPGLIIAGVDDPGRHRPGVAAAGQADTADSGPLLAGLPRDKFVLFLKHQPDVPEGHGRFDLQLSGHTHAGQIYPFRWLTRLRYPMLAGLYDLPGGGQLYVSRGTGTWGPPIRVFAPAEITVIELVPAS